MRFGASLVALNAKVMLAIPMLYYQTVLARSAVLWPEYRALKNGIINRDANGNEIVEILCDPQRVKLIFDFANRICRISLLIFTRSPTG